MNFTFNAKIMNHEGATKWYGVLSVHGPKESAIVKAWGPIGRISGLTLDPGPYGIVISKTDFELRKRMSRGYNNRIYDMNDILAVGPLSSLSSKRWMSILKTRSPILNDIIANYFEKDNKLDAWMLSQLGPARSDKSLLREATTASGSIEQPIKEVSLISVALTAMSDFGDW